MFICGVCDMKIIKKVKEMQETALKLKKTGKTAGLVPTMGALHAGHLSLVKRSKNENDITVVSIFVNPTQFGPNEDFEKYPRMFEADEKLLKDAKADIVFYPSKEEMYGKDHQTVIDLERLPGHLCGLKREGHFKGVATVVAKLFNIVQPTAAYFGQKDYQQAAIISQMVLDLNIPVKVRVMPIVREKDGLAMSSRNRYLSPQERKDALVLSKSLKLADFMIKSGIIQTQPVLDAMRKLILKEAPDAKIDYMNIVDPVTLDDVAAIGKKAVIALAVFIGKTRLIDNLIVKKG